MNSKPLQNIVEIRKNDPDKPTIEINDPEKPQIFPSKAVVVF